ncbi:MAG: hypothetical protein WA001_03260 [Patescibacteria group bacterium]
MLRKILPFLLLLLVASQSLFALPLSAQVIPLDPGFDPNHVLEDNDIFDVNGMTYAQMVAFLQAKGTLADAKQVDIDGVVKPVPDIIWRVSNSYKINPKYILALIQKEQSLVEDPDPSQGQFDWAAGYGVCDSCSKNDPSIQDYKGFASQLEWSAKQFREKYMLQLLGGGTTKAGDAQGKPVTIDGEVITPTNLATAMLYSYTPHLSGNLNLWRIWQRWFSLSYPDGTVVQGEPSGSIYLIRLGQKRQFSSPIVMETMVDPNKIIKVSDTNLAAYPDGGVIRFPQYSLLQDQEGKVWLLTDTGRRYISNMAAFRKFGFNTDEIVKVQDTDLTEYPIVNPAITVNTQFPQGTVLQDKTTKQYWYVEDGVRQLIPDKAFLVLYFRGRTIKQVTDASIGGYTLGNPYNFADGELVRGKTSPAVYVSEGGTLQPILSADTFTAIGWSWGNVVTVSDAAIKDYTVGDPFTLQSAAPTLGEDSTITTLNATSTLSTL